MDLELDRDLELVTRLRRLDTSAVPPAAGFDYAGMLERHAADIARRRRRQLAARGTAAGAVVALALASLWRIGQVPEAPAAQSTTVAATPSEPRIVRADTYLALAALEDHIASVDDALTFARLGGGSADVARLERTRAELVDSYTQVRYAGQVSANF
jgi:hypothetical protein